MAVSSFFAEEGDNLNMSEIVDSLIEANYLHRLLTTAIEQVPLDEYKKAEKKIKKISKQIFDFLSSELRKRRFTAFEELLFFDMIHRTVASKYFKKYGGIPEGKDIDVAYS